MPIGISAPLGRQPRPDVLLLIDPTTAVLTAREIEEHAEAELEPVPLAACAAEPAAGAQRRRSARMRAHCSAEASQSLGGFTDALESELD